MLGFWVRAAKPIPNPQSTPVTPLRIHLWQGSYANSVSCRALCQARVCHTIAVECTSNPQPLESILKAVFEFMPVVTMLEPSY